MVPLDRSPALLLFLNFALPSSVRVSDEIFRRTLPLSSTIRFCKFSSREISSL